MTAIAAQLRGWEELIQWDEFPTIPSSLVLKLPEDFTKRRIAEMFGEFVILEHPGDIQSFDIDGLVLADRRSREFMNVVGANISNSGVLFRYFDSLLVAIVRAFDLARKLALFEAKSLCGLVQWSGIVKSHSIAASRQSFDSHINADIGGRLRQWLNLGFDQNTNEIPLGFVFADRCADELRIIGQRTRPADLKRLILPGKRDPTVSVGESIRLIAHRLFVLAAFEARICGPFLEEVVKRGIKVSERLLQNDAAHFIQKGFLRLLLPLRQGFGCLSVAQGLLRFLVGFRAQLKSQIPNKTRTAKGSSKLVLLGIGRKEPVFIGFLNNHAHSILSRFAPCGAAKFISTQVAWRLWLEHSFAF
jgi:hypothetical protein